MGMLEEIATGISAPLAPFVTSYGVVGVNIFAGVMPDSPDDCIALLALPGSPPVETMRPVPVVTNESLQVLVRSKSFLTGQTTAQTLWNDLHWVIETTLAGTRYHVIRSIQSPFLLERDESRRNIFSCTFNVMRKV